MICNYDFVTVFDIKNLAQIFLFISVKQQYIAFSSLSMNSKIFTHFSSSGQIVYAILMFTQNYNSNLEEMVVGLAMKLKLLTKSSRLQKFGANFAGGTPRLFSLIQHAKTHLER